MARPNWEYVRIDVLLPDNPKLDGMSGAAKWTLIELWCYCGQHLTDGFVRETKWRRFGTARIRRQIIEQGLAEPVPGGYQMHDYLEHQRSRAEVEAVREKRRQAGLRSAEARAKAKAAAEQDAQHSVEHDAQQNGSKPATEAEAEAEAEADLSMADAGDQSAGRNARGREMTDLIIKEIQNSTGRVITPDWASRIADHILSGHSPSNPAAYVRQAIRAEPNPHTRFLPHY